MKFPEQYRHDTANPYMPHQRGDDFGWFKIPSQSASRIHKTYLYCLASSGNDEIRWEHVSVHAGKNINNHIKQLIPTWDEMCLVKSLFWNPDEWVVQYHPAAAEYVNQTETVLHLWRPIDVEIPTPPIIAV